MKQKIKVKSTNDIQKINRIVCPYSCDMRIHSKSGMVDTKSLLGLFAFNLNKRKFPVVEVPNY